LEKQQRSPSKGPASVTPNDNKRGSIVITAPETVVQEYQKLAREILE